MIQKISRVAPSLVFLMLLFSCSPQEEKEDTVDAVSKNGSVETVVSVEHADAHDILVTKHKIWVKKQLAKEIVTKDTIPALGDTLLLIEKEGKEIPQSTKKDYEFFITVQ